MDTISKVSDFDGKSVRPKASRLPRSVLRSTAVEEKIALSHQEDESASGLCESVSDVSIEDVCGPCKVSGGKQIKPEWFCNDCDDHLCSQCVSVHEGLKITSSHTLITYEENVKSSQQVPCGPCKEVEAAKIVAAAWYCRKCDEFLCDSCRAHHRGLKVTRSHSLISKEERSEDVRTIVQKQETDELNNRQTANQRESKVISSKPYVERSVSHIRQHRVKLVGDEKTPNITGSSFVSNSQFILADYDNKCLKLFELQSDGFSIVIKRKLNENPWAVDVYNESELAVTIDQSIGRFLIDRNKIKDKGKITVGFDCHDVAYINRDTVAAVGSPSTFCVLNVTNGTQLWKLDDPGVFSDPWSLTLNTAKTKAYVSDGDINVKTIELTGFHPVTSTIEFVHDACIYGVTIDNEDNVYICNYCNETIQQISAGGHVRTLLTKNDGVVYPKTISISPDGTTFIICSEVGDAIVFKFE